MCYPALKRWAMIKPLLELLSLVRINLDGKLRAIIVIKLDNHHAHY